MPEQWMVRVEGKEYGPVDEDELREWREEGRLIPQNEVRRVGDDRWIPAGDVPEIFAAAEPPAEPPDLVVRRRTWPEIWRETIRIYRAGFWRFLLFGLLTAVPMFVLQWYFPRVPLPDLASGSMQTMPTVTVPPICWLMVLLVVLLWPVSTAGFQYVADDVLRGRQRSLENQFAAALQRWGRMLSAGLVVYASYFFWVFVPFTAMIALLSAGVSVLSLMLYLLAGAFMVYMIGRLFVNFLFWEQTAAFSDEGALLALRESKELARCASDAPRLDRPLWRGVLVASVWLVLLLVVLMAVQFPIMLVRLSGVENPEQAVALMQTLSQAKTPDPLMIASDVVSALVNLVLRPLMAASFIVLYYDAKARLGKRPEDQRPTQ
ncbi:MAG TPA: GYF domain-containing protein [Chthoniobacterales bacterium]|nr:GYF domain-containing protein [Chthoniobacterales bacterium]